MVVDDAKSFLDALGLRAFHNTLDLPVLSLNGHVNGAKPSAKEHVNGASNGVATNGLSKTGPNYHFFCLSSTDEAGLKRCTEGLRQHVEAKEGNVGDVSAWLRKLSYTLASKRSMLNYTSFTVASSLAELASALQAQPDRIRYMTSPRLALVFTGQGAQWERMGLELRQYTAFAESCQAASDHMRSLGCTWSVEGEWSAGNGESSRINSPLFAQTLCTILQVALVDLLRHLSVTPEAVVGHS